MAGLGSWGQFTFFPREGAPHQGLAQAEKSKLSPAPTLPRHLHRAVLRLLRPAEAAARRLIIAASRGITVPVPRLAKPKPKPQSMVPLMRQYGLAVSYRFAAAEERRWNNAKAKAKGGRIPAFCLFDPRRRLNLHGRRRRTTPPHAAPRVMFPGFSEPHKLPPPPSPDDPIDVSRLGQRIAALAAALDDLPGQARRFARWKARRDAGLEQRTWPIRRGRPPGGRLTRWDPDAQSGDVQGRKSPRNIREIDEILAHAHSLAIHALESPDTS
jgi:hypothetical protein